MEKTIVFLMGVYTFVLDFMHSRRDVAEDC